LQSLSSRVARAQLDLWRTYLRTPALTPFGQAAARQLSDENVASVGLCDSLLQSL